MGNSTARVKQTSEQGAVGNLGTSSILVVDDDEVILAIVKRILSPEFNVETANGAEEALARLDAGAQYVAALCDLSMPRVGGLELLQMIRQRDLDLPVIIVTGQGSLQSAMDVMQYGGFRYLTKPFEHEDLIGAVRAASATRQIEVLRRRAVEICDSGAWRVASNSNLDRHFDEALQNIFMAFQPIVQDEGQTVYGYEALVRSSGPELTNPGLLFDAAERLGRVRDIGREVRRKVAAQIPHAPSDASIFVNLHALDLGDDELFSTSAPLSQHATRVVLEITERASLDQMKDLSDRIVQLRMMGYRIAVDDLGAGYAGLATFSQLSPDVAKLDMSLIRDIDTEPRKASIVRSMLQVCQRDLETRVVCEGIETPAELAALRSLNADLLQGYLFARPAPEFRRGDLFPAVN